MHTFTSSTPIEFLDGEYPCKAWMIDDGQDMTLRERGSTFFVFALASVQLEDNDGRWWALRAGMSARVPSSLSVTGRAIVIQKMHEVSMLQVVGPVETTGRLKYIDGCTDTLLISPLKKGEACLNHLHFPQGIQQTMHTHPSVRIGTVWSGEGICYTDKGQHKLQPGVGWYLPVNGQHCFHTSDSHMDVIAWHPDTDTGPQDENHPMINRTYVNDVSARLIDSIRTK